MLRIALTTPKGQTSEIECTIDACSIGKDGENLIALQGWSVAKKHATLQRKPEDVFVEDLGSNAGTEVNGKKIKRHGPLASGDKIAIAGYTIQVLDLYDASAAPAAPAAAGAAPAPSAPLAPAAPAKPAAPVVRHTAAQEAMTQHLKRIHQKLIKQMDLRRIDVSRQSEEELRVN